MILSKRERLVAIIALVVAVGFGLEFYLVSPLMERRALADTNMAKFREKNVEPTQKRIRENRANEKRLAEMAAVGLDLDFNNAKFVLLQAVDNWGRESGLSISQRSGDRPEQEKQFQKITLHLTTTGNMASIARFLWRVNTAAIPARISDLQITPRREGTDDLQLQVSISTICFAPEVDKFGRPVVSATTKPIRLPARIDGSDTRSLFSRYSVLWDRNIFSYTRRVEGEVPVVDRGPPGPRPTETFALRGTTELKDIESTKGPYAALIENGNTGTTDRYYLGDTIAGGKVVNIGYDYVDFEIAGQIRHIEVGKNLEGGTQISRADALPTTMPSADGSGSATPVTGGITGGSVDSIAERMRQRRMAETRRSE